MKLRAILGTLLLLAVAAHGAANASKPQASAIAGAHSGDCFSNAFAAAHRAYRQHYRADWYVKMSAIVQQNEVAEVELNVGPYDGSVGGSVVAKYRCSDGALVTLKYER